MSYLLTHLPIAAMLASAVVSFLSAIQVVYGVRAKHRIKAILARERKPYDLPEQSARSLIEKAAERLSERDKTFIYKGLNQRSRVGEDRFIQELTS